MIVSFTTRNQKEAGYQLLSKQGYGTPINSMIQEPRWFKGMWLGGRHWASHDRHFPTRPSPQASRLGGARFPEHHSKL